MPVLGKVKDCYILWYGYYQILPKTHRYSLGVKIDKLFVEIIESVAVASFLPKDEKLPWVKLAIRKTDTLKVMLLVLWEIKSLEDKQFIAISEKIEDFGRDLGGWNGKLKQNPVR